MSRVKIEKRLRKAQLRVDLGQEHLTQQQVMLDFGSPSAASPRAMWLLRDLEYMQGLHVNEAERLRNKLARLSN